MDPVRKRKMTSEGDALIDKDTKTDHKNTMDREKSPLLLAMCFLGIFVSYLVFGMLQERITRGKYGDGTDKFTFIYTLIFIQCVVNALFAKGIIVYKRGSAHDFVQDHTPWSLYTFCAASYCGAMVASNKALKFIPYPTQVIGKSCKPLAVMILGILWARKKYTLRKFLCVLLIVIGVAMFMYNPDKASGSDGFTFGFGEMLLLVSLTLDGFTAAFQERMRSEEYRTTEHVMMYNMNWYSCILLGISILFTGEYSGFIEFQSTYPSVWGLIFVFSLCSAVGQHFIFLTVVQYGPLTCSIITTTRKFFTVLCSVFLFRNPMTIQKWLATVLVFTGLGLDAVYGKNKKKHQQK